MHLSRRENFLFFLYTGHTSFLPVERKLVAVLNAGLVHKNDISIDGCVKYPCLQVEMAAHRPWIGSKQLGIGCLQDCNAVA